jgi:farnesyl-diphosphate farnesyltransferase
MNLAVRRPAPDSDRDRRTRALLPRVSRTFALGIKLLPARLELPVRLGYLLCRIADTVEDDLALPAPRKAVLLDRFLACFEDPAQADAFAAHADELTADEAYLDLVAATGDVFALYRTLEAGTQRILRGWIGEMVSGMREVVLAHPEGIRIRSIEELQRYCYFVAGTVGHLLTDLWHEHSGMVDERVYARLLVDCEAFGEALQTVNILKDIAWDAEHENAIYVPADLLAAAGSAHGLVLDDEARPANRAALEAVIALAHDDIERALRYIESLPLAALRIRLFCVLPILFAIATVREIERTDEMFRRGGAVKISRAEVRALMLASTTSMLTNRTLRWLVERVRQRPFTFGGS